MSKQLTDRHRRVLCELIGEPYHELKDRKVFGGSVCSCGMLSPFCQEVSEHVKKANRTFTNWNDYGACIEAIKAQGLYEDFYYYCTQVCNRMFSPWEFNRWSQDPARCLEIAEWLIQRQEAK